MVENSPASERTVRVTEIFYSLQGESRTAGYPTVFVRLTGCPLRCGYCDTEYAFTGGERMLLPDIVNKVSEFNPRYVTVTGGEPLAQPDCRLLIKMLCDHGYSVSVETSGALDVSIVDRRASIVMDLKTPGSGEADRNRIDNLEHLRRKDQIKFVITDRADYEWSRKLVADRKLENLSEVLFSPVHGTLAARDLADWIIEDNLPVRMQIQLHKYLWGDECGR
jgi:7-carboxy-7-deazaguanine synthase